MIVTQAYWYFYFGLSFEQIPNGACYNTRMHLLLYGVVHVVYPSWLLRRWFGLVRWKGHVSYLSGLCSHTREESESIRIYGTKDRSLRSSLQTVPASKVRLVLSCFMPLSCQQLICLMCQGLFSVSRISCITECLMFSLIISFVTSTYLFSLVVAHSQKIVNCNLMNSRLVFIYFC